MNVLWTAHIANIGCVGSGASYQVQQIFVPREEARPGCQLPVGRTAEDAVEAPPPGEIIQPLTLPGATDPPRLAVAAGRFEWMTFHMAAMVIFPGIAFVALLVIYRNLGGLRAKAVIAAAVTGGALWALSSVGDPAEFRMDTASLLLPTRAHALAHYDAAFAQLAWAGVRLDYGGGLFVTVLVVVAAASVLADTGALVMGQAERLEAKRRDLKLIIAAGALLLTFLAVYVGEWLAWPARLIPPEHKALGAEIRSMASGLRLYFGTGYSLALLAFAVPAVLQLPSPRKKQRAAAAGTRSAATEESAELADTSTSSSSPRMSWES
ncbi:MAG TPA: hypothetical protein VGW34_04755 [Allosphingosinicella sp.]|nr:hypothetical protein [Allosphingosinicella sp.]